MIIATIPPTNAESTFHKLNLECELKALMISKTTPVANATMRAINQMFVDVPRDFSLSIIKKDNTHATKPIKGLQFNIFFII
jgi:hypothetical protein